MLWRFFRKQTAAARAAAGPKAKEMKMKNLSGLPAGTIDTLLFDLDGTLIDLSPKATRLFYLRAFSRFRPLFNPLSFFLSFKTSMKALLANRSDRFNHDVFLEHMARCGRTTPDAVDRLVSEMIEKDFRSLKPYFTPVARARDAVCLAKALGYRLAIVTNPVFPARTVLYRLDWAGLDAADFFWITHSQNMNRTKPGVAFYTELLARLALDPARCLMIGNSPEEDLPARDAGIRTFLVQTPLSARAIRKSLADKRLDACGGYDDLMEWMRKEKEPPS